MRLSDTLVIVRGAGELGTGVAHRLTRSGFTVMLTELAQPTTLRRGAAFAEAVYSGQATVEGITARLADDPMLGMAYSVVGEVPVVVDLADDAVGRMRPALLVDARPEPRAPATRRDDARLVIGLGAGFAAGDDCHAVVGLGPGPSLGRVYWEGSVEPSEPRRNAEATLLRAAVEGIFQSQVAIGEAVQPGQTLASIGDQQIQAPDAGVVRGVLHGGVPVVPGMAVVELSPNAPQEDCFEISSWARAIGGGVLEAALEGMAHWAAPAPEEDDE